VAGDGVGGDLNLLSLLTTDGVNDHTSLDRLSEFGLIIDTYFETITGGSLESKKLFSNQVEDFISSFEKYAKMYLIEQDVFEERAGVLLGSIASEASFISSENDRVTIIKEALGGVPNCFGISIPGADDGGIVNLPGALDYFNTLNRFGIGFLPFGQESTIPVETGNIELDDANCMQFFSSLADPVGFIEFQREMTRRLTVLEWTDFVCDEVVLGDSLAGGGPAGGGSLVGEDNPVIEKISKSCNWFEWNRYIANMVSRLRLAAIDVDNAQMQVGEGILIDLKNLVDEHVLPVVGILRNGLDCRWLGNGWNRLLGSDEHGGSFHELIIGMTGTSIVWIVYGLLGLLMILIELLIWRQWLIEEEQSSWQQQQQQQYQECGGSQDVVHEIPSAPVVATGQEHVIVL